jgi:glycosyltransferase involved in cell wall biosynthesis
MIDVLIVSLGGTAGLREADAELAGALRRAGAAVETVSAARPREWRTMAAIELAWALNARRAARAGIAAHQPRAVLYSSTTAALLGPAPGAIRFDAPAAGNRPGRHGIWQRRVERARFEDAPLLVPWSEGGLAEAPKPHADAVVVPVPVESSDAAGERDIAAIAYGANPEKKGLDRVLAAWARDARPGEELVVAGLDAAAGAAWLRRAASAPGTASRGAVRFAGMLSRADYRALLRRARVFIAAPRREDYGIAQLEALADGCMLVTTPSPGPYAALPIAHALDPRLVSPGLDIRAALDEPSDGYAERAATALAAFSPQEVDRVVARDLLPLLKTLSSA